MNKYANIDKELVKTIIYHDRNNYRNKLILHGKDNYIGLYKENTNEIIPIQTCLISNPKINEIIKVLNNTNKEIKEVIIKTSNDNSKVMVKITGTIEDTSILEKLCNVLIINNKYLTKDKVIETHADVGVAYDGDGDRVGVIDNNGKMVDIDKYMIIIWRDLVNKDVPKKTFYDIKCGLCLKDELDKLGIENEYYRTGNSYTKLKSYEGNYPFSGELSGHVFFRDKFNGYDDGIYASLRLIEILTNTNKNVSELLEGINKYYTTPEIKVSVSDDIKFDIIDRIKKYCEDNNYKILTIDGVKVFFLDGSALVRASNTGPNITMRFEAKSDSRLEEIKSEFTNLVNKFIGE